MRLRAWAAPLVAWTLACTSCGAAPQDEGATPAAPDAAVATGSDTPARADAGASRDGGADAKGGAPSVPGDASASDGGARPDGPVADGRDAAPLPAPPPALRAVVAGYYPNWTESPARLRDVDSHYNLIYLFAATPVGGSPGTTGAVEWSMPGDGRGAATNFKADMDYARRVQGRKIVLSVGGAGAGMSFPSRTRSQAFVDSIARIYAQLGGFDGLDWNTFEADQAPDTAEMIWISQTLKSRYPGFLITAPPAPWKAIDKVFCADMAKAGVLDYCAPQYYDGPGLAVQSYVAGSVDEWTKLLGEDKVVVGFGVASAANYMAIGAATATWKAVKAKHPALRGAFDWEIHGDEGQGWPFAKQVGALVAP